MRRAATVQARERVSGRARSAAAVAGLHLAAGYALLSGIGSVPAAVKEAPLKLIDLPQAVPPQPPPAPRVERRAEKRPLPRKAEGAPAPRPVPLVAPVPEVVLPVTSPVVSAPVPGDGADIRAGSGTGGTGSGSGSGGAGSGGGGDGGVVSRARLLSGRLLDRDYPRSASRARAGGTVIARFAVGADGRATGCRVTRSSGHADLDATTCRLIEKRFRYAPARGADGRAVADVMGWKQDWWLERRGD